MEKKQNVFVAYGIISAIIVIIFYLLLYLGGIEWWLNPIAYLGYVLPIVMAVLAAVKQKKLQDGYLSFGEALKGVFIVFVITGIGSTLFQYVLFNYIDVPFRDAMSQKIAQMTEETLRKFGMGEDDIEKATDEILTGKSYTAGRMLLGFAFGCIISFIVALIIAAIVKRKKPEFPQSQFNG
jgi:hypothetical protein